MILIGLWFLFLAILGLLSLGLIVKSVISGQLSPILVYVVVVFSISLSVEAVLLLKLRAQVDDYRAAWNSLQNQGEDSLLYVAMGDSAAQGIGASSINNSYVKLVAKQLEIKTGRPVTIINLSQSGAKLQDFRDKQLPQLKNLTPDLVTVDIGANNIAAGTPENEIIDDYQIIIKELSLYPTVFANLPDFMWGKEQRNTKTINQLIRQACRDNNVSLADVHHQTKSKMWSLNEFAADGFHPNNSGHKTWARAFETSLAKELGPKIN